MGLAYVARIVWGATLLGQTFTVRAWIIEMIMNFSYELSLSLIVVRHQSFTHRAITTSQPYRSCTTTLIAFSTRKHDMIVAGGYT